MADTKTTKAREQFIGLIKQAMAGHPEKPSLREVARRADLSPAYLSLLLNGERETPSNEAIAQLERVLRIPDGDLFKAAGRPDDKALEFFRKDEAGSIMRTLAALPKSQLPGVQKLIEDYARKPRHK
jgi:transcriptional regulator with XRE-family HTH domain